jgi:methionyl-tRNA synthetase
MFGQGWGQIAQGNFQFHPVFLVFIIIDLVLKGISLWRSARNRQQYWFVALLLVNSFGILPAIYLIFFEKRGRKSFHKK